MRKYGKMISMILCSAMLVSGVSSASFVEKADAAVKNYSTQYVLKTGDASAENTSGSSITSEPESTESAVPESTPGEDATQEPEKTPDAQSTQEPEKTPAAQSTQEPEKTPAASVTPAGVTATTTNAAITTAAAVGTKFSYGNFNYAVTKQAQDKVNGEVKVTGLTTAGAGKTTLYLRETVVKDGVTYDVTGIGSKAFKGSHLKKVVIKKNVKFIGVRAFQQSKSLETVILGEGVTTLKERAFAGCSSLRTIAIPSKVNFIGVKVFYNCSKLKAVALNTKKITKIRTSAFKNNKKGRYFTMPSGKKALYNSLLKGSGTSAKIYTY